MDFAVGKAPLNWLRDGVKSDRRAPLINDCFQFTPNIMNADLNHAKASECLAAAGLRANGVLRF